MDTRLAGKLCGGGDGGLEHEALTQDWQGNDSKEDVKLGMQGIEKAEMQAAARSIQLARSGTQGTTDGGKSTTRNGACPAECEAIKGGGD